MVSDGSLRVTTCCRKCRKAKQESIRVEELVILIHKKKFWGQLCSANQLNSRLWAAMPAGGAIHMLGMSHDFIVHPSFPLLNQRESSVFP